VENPRYGGDEAGSPGPTFTDQRRPAVVPALLCAIISQIISESGTSYHLPTRGPDETEAVTGPEREITT
jgi:hypothetical protein